MVGSKEAIGGVLCGGGGRWSCVGRIMFFIDGVVVSC